MSLSFPVKAGLLGACMALVQTLALNAQQVIDFDAENAATILSSGSLDISNVEYSGCNEQFLLLTGVGPIGIDCGMLMSSGNASNWLCNNNYDLTNCAGTAPIASTLLTIANSVPGLIGQSFSVNSVNDIAFIEFDVVAEGDFIGFDFIFYSDEYTAFINSQYNDVFALLASGPGIAGPNGESAINLAVVPDSDPALPITISSVHPDLNATYYVDDFPPQFCANGGTDRLSAVLETVPDSTYHFQFGIADGTDSAVNSYVLVSGLVSGEMVGCGDPLACNYCGSAITYADSVCTYAEIELLDTLDIGGINPSCPTVIATSTLNGDTIGLFSGLSGDIEWSIYPGVVPPASTAVEGTLDGSSLTLQFAPPQGPEGEYGGSLLIQGSSFCTEYEIPISLLLTSDAQTSIEATAAWTDGVLEGGTTCLTAGSSTGFFDAPLPGLCNEFYDGDSSLMVQWSSIPVNSTLQFTELSAVVCSAPYISVSYTNATPGFYAGEFLLIDPQGTGTLNCNSISIPFSFFVQDVVTIADAVWSHALNGDTVCSSWVIAEAEFDSPFYTPLCPTFLWSPDNNSDIEVEWLSPAPHPTVAGASVTLCGEGTASLALTDIPADDHAGYLRVEVEGLCEVLHVPFSFSALDAELTTISINPNWNSIIGESGCTMEGSAMATFAIPDSLCSGVPLVLDEGGSFGVDVEWSLFPEGSAFSFGEATATACAPEGSLTVQYMNGTPGEYAGTFILSPLENCVQYHLPFEFTLTNPTAEPALLDPDLVPNSQGQFEVCSATSATLGSNGSFAVNPGGIVEWIWNLNGETTSQDSSEPITATLEGPGALIATLTVVDSLGCVSPDASLVILHSTEPEYALEYPAIACLGTPFEVSANNISGGFWTNGEINADIPSPIFISDAGGVTYTSNLLVDDFEDGELLTSCTDFLSVSVNMEHSYLGDLDILIECPNGTSVPLLSFPNGGGGTFLGEAVDDGSTVAGVGYDYSWSPSTANTTNINDNVNWTSSTYIDNAGNNETNNIVNSGLYFPDGDLCNLVGCPLNGNWTLTVIDNLSIDNGHIFDWGLTFNPDLLGNLIVSVQPSIGLGPDSSMWSGAGITDLDPSGNAFQAQLDELGVYEYTFDLTNDFGCAYDTTIQIEVVEGNYPLSMNWNGAPLGGSTTCSGDIFYINGNFIFPEGLDFTNYIGWSLDDNMTLVWDTFPLESELDFGWTSASYDPFWSPEGNFYTEILNATPGQYSGEFILSVPESCIDLSVPFSFTISDDPALVDALWSGNLNGNATCASWGIETATFANPFTTPNCPSYNWSPGNVSVLDLVWTSNGPHPEMSAASVSLCDIGVATIQYTNAPIGTHQGYLRAEVNGLCEVLHVPFAFTVTEGPENPIEIDPIWLSAFDSEGCAVSGEAMATFEVDETLCSAAPLVLNATGSFGIDIEWEEFPSGSTLQMDAAEATLCDGTGSFSVQFSNGSDGDYSGAFVLTPTDVCLEFRIPFSFSLANPTAIPSLLSPDLTPEESGEYHICSPVDASIDGVASFAPEGHGGIVEWIWNLNGETTSQDSSEPITATLEGPGALIATLTVVDSLGCVSPDASLVILHSTEPEYALEYPAIACLGTPFEVSANNISGGFWTNGEINADIPSPIFISDAGGVTYTSNLLVDDFEDGELLTSCTDFLSVSVNMEHSYLGDLDILIECPNGTSVPLLSFPNGGGGTFLGEAVDDGSTVAGVGYDYSWSPSTANTTNINDNVNWTSSTYIDNAGNNETNNIVNSGLYFPDGDLCNLVGCPLNGNWTLTVIDNLSIDNGHIFDWGLTFNPDLLGNLIVSVQPSIGLGPDSSMWSGAGITDLDPSGNAFQAQLDELGVYEYTFDLTNDFGCAYDTTIQIEVVEGNYPLSMNWSGGPFDENTTCSDIYSVSATFDIPPGVEIAAYNSWFLGDNMTLVWSTYPAGSELDFGWTSASYDPFWSPEGNFYTEILNASPGQYSGEFILSVTGSCIDLSVPFSFNLVNEPVSVMADWSNQLNGSTTCATWINETATFDSPFYAPDCPTFNWTPQPDNALSVVWTSSGPHPDIAGASVSICDETVSLALINAPTGVHSGYLSVMVDGNCETLHIPFVFNVSSSDPTITEINSIWPQSFEDEGCNVNGEAHAIFQTDADWCLTELLTMGPSGSFGLSIEWASFPDGSTLQIDGAQANLCSAPGSLTVQFSGASAGDYEGTFILQPSSGCEEYHIPFSFTLNNPTAIPTLLSPNIEPDETGRYAVCDSTTFTVTGPNSYALPGQGGISTWKWNLNGDLIDMTSPDPVTITIDSPGGVAATLTVIDGNGCASADSALIFVQSPTPVAELEVSTTVCAGSPGVAEVTGVDAGYWTNAGVQQLYEGGTPLPDNTTFQSSLIVDQYPDGATLEDCSDLQAIHINMEHSFMGDLDISVTCPNGTSVPLLAFPNGGGSIDFGEAGPGVGYDYSWSPAPPTSSNVDDSQNWTDGSAIPGTYAADGDLCDFSGCPLNGEWTLTFVDNYGADDGTLFSWGIDVAQDMANAPFIELAPNITSLSWEGTGLFDADEGTTGFMVDDVGVYALTLTMVNGLGCAFDSTLQIQAIEGPDLPLSAGEDLLLCGDAVSLSASLGDDGPSPCSHDAESVTYCYDNTPYTHWTYCPNEPGDGTMMSIQFEAGELENGWDYLYVYDGFSEDAPLLIQLTGPWEAFSVTAENPLGCLYVVITSDGIISCEDSDSFNEIQWCAGCGGSSCGYDWSWEPAEWLSDPNSPTTLVEGLTETTAFVAAVTPSGFEYCATVDTVIVEVPEFEWECDDAGSLCMDGTTWDEGLGQCIHTDPCPWDLTGDGQVTTSDLLSFLGSFAIFCETDETVWPEEAAYCGPGTTWSAEDGGCIPDEACPADFTGDGIVGLADLLLLLPQMGNYCE